MRVRNALMHERCTAEARIDLGCGVALNPTQGWGCALRRALSGRAGGSSAVASG